MDFPSTSDEVDFINLPIEPEQNTSADDLTKQLLSNIDNDEYNEESSDSEERSVGDYATSSTVDVKKRRRPNHTKLSPALMGLMGEANLRFVKGDMKTAEKICHEIIRQVPYSPEPYQTLAHIYEDEPDTAFKFSLLAAQLSHTDAEEWLKLADYAKQKGDYKQTMMCYSKAIRAQPQCLKYHLIRLELTERVIKEGLPVGSLNISLPLCYFYIVKSLPATQSDLILKYAKLALNLFHSSNDSDKAVEVMEIAFKKCAAAFTNEDLNMFAELLISQGLFDRCLEVLVASAGIEIEADVLTLDVEGMLEEKTQYVKCTIPEELPIDIKTKLLVCFIHLRAFNVVVDLLETYLSNYLDKDGDLFIDIEEALTSVGEHEAALRILKLLIKSESFNLPGVWLKYADCLYKLGMKEEALDAYRIVMKDAPHYTEVRMKLVSILEEIGTTDEILEILQQDYNTPVNHGLLFERFKLLKKQNKLSEALKIGELLLSPFFYKFSDPQDYRFSRTQKSYQDHVSIFKRKSKSYFDINFEEDSIVSFTPESEWNILNDLLLMCKDFKKYDIMERIAFSALGSKNLSSYRADLDLFCLQACMLNKDYHNSYLLIRDFFMKFYEYSAAWNFAYLCLNISKDSRIERFMLKYSDKTESVYNDYIELIDGNKNIATYQTCLKQYLSYYSKTQDPMVALILGGLFLQMANMRTVKNHNQVMLHGLSFLNKYKSARCCKQEVYYNFGRAYQNLNINHLAVAYYEKALECEPGTHCEEHSFIDLQRETAYNLFMLYKKQSPHLALMYLQKYIVI